MAKKKSSKAHSLPERKAPAPGQPADHSVSKKSFDFLSSQNTTFVYLLLFVLVAAVFLPCIRNDFFYWFGDDPGYVTENAHVQSGITVAGIKWAFCNIELGNWHPLTFLSHMLDCQIYGLKPWGHHLTSVLIHAANTLLLFVVLRRLTGARWRSLAVALLFGVHPLRVESVAWVAERKDVLAVFFWMLTLLAYVRYVEESKAQQPKSKLFYALALAGFAGGLMSKGIVVTLPFTLLLLDYWPLQRKKRVGKLLLEKVPFFGLAIATSVITYVAQKNWGFVQTVEKYSMAARLENAVVSYGRYVGKMFWPTHLGFYPHPGQWPVLAVLIAAVFVVGITIWSIAMRRHRPWLLVGWLWYLGTLVPVIGIVQLGDVAMADRYSYVPMIGILLALAWELHERTKGWRYQTVISTASITVVFLGCITLTEKLIPVFKDSVTVWRHNFKLTGNTDVAQNALGLSLEKEGRTNEAILELQAVVKAKPNLSQVRFNLGTMLLKSGRVDEAIKEYREAINLNTNYNNAHYGLGQALLGQGFVEAATFEFKEMIRYNHDARAYTALGKIVASTGHYDEAIPYFKEAIKESPNYVDAYSFLGVALVYVGHADEAKFYLQEALKLDPTCTLALTYLDQLEKSNKISDK